MAKNISCGIRKIIPLILFRFTGIPRYLPVIQWSQKSIIYNLFRIYEIIFWRKKGIRIEAATQAYTNEKGIKILEQHWFFTWESLLVHYEQVFYQLVYQYIKNLFSFHFEWIPIAIPAFAGIPGYQHREKTFSPLGYFAIAFDAATDSSTGVDASSLTYAHTCTGSNGLITVAATWTGPSTDFTDTKYAAVTVTIEQTQDYGNTINLGALAGPATGSNNVVVTLSATRAISSGAISFSGAAQTSYIDGENSAQGNSQTASASITTSIANTFVTDGMSKGGGETPTEDGSQTQRWQELSGLRSGGSTKQQVSPGAVTMQWTWSPTNRAWGICVIGIAEASSGTASGDIMRMSMGF